MASNPFRKKGPASDSADRPSIPQAASSAAFLQSIQTTSITADADGDISRGGRTTKKKVVKRVRVQSPPPLSPDSPTTPHYDSDNDAFRPVPTSTLADPFENRFPANPDSIKSQVQTNMPEAAPLVAANRGADTIDPFNTVQTQGLGSGPGPGPQLDTQGIEGDRGSATAASAPGKGTMDVNAFQRLLLTGQSGSEVITPPSTTAPSAIGGVEGGSGNPPLAEGHHNQGPTDDAGSRQASQSSIPGLPTAQKKAPPPPSSRHGKSLKIEAVSNRPSSSSSSTNSLTARSPTDVNKPLPPAPRARDPDGAEDIFTQEAAGKVPENDEPTAAPTAPPAAAPIIPTSGKKPTPAPPPRRGHSRTESKSIMSPAQDDDAQPRSSFDSQSSSRPGSITAKHAPAPPPRRRPGKPQRQSSQSTTAPPPETLTQTTETEEPESITSPFEQPSAEPEDAGKEDPLQQHKIAPPPPPPARNPSTRRPQPRRTSNNKDKDKENSGMGTAGPGAPPPPPPRARGSSKGSMDVPVPQAATAEDPGKGADILADLNALQREVDALRGKMGT